MLSPSLPPSPFFLSFPPLSPRSVRLDAEPTPKDEEQGHTMCVSPPEYNSGDDAVAVSETLLSRAVRDEERCVIDPPPPSQAVDVEKTARGRTTRARVVLALGLMLEVSATLWAFQQAVSAGAFLGDADCSKDGSLDNLFVSSLFLEDCTGGQIFDGAALENLTSIDSTFDEYVSCDNVTDSPTGALSFEQRCTCLEEITHFTPCSWIAISTPSDDNCYAQGVVVDSVGVITGAAELSSYDDCLASNPLGTVEITVTALVVALSSQVLEAVVGFKFWRDNERRTANLMLVATVYEALGVIAVSSVLLSLPGLYDVSEDTPQRLPVFFYLVWTIIAVVVAGVLAEITAERCDRAAGRFPYLGAVGNALVWLGAALIEIVVTSYLLWTGAGIKDFVELVVEAAGLFSLELLGLLAVWVARFLWTRHKLLRSVKVLEGPLKKSITSTPIDWRYELVSAGAGTFRLQTYARP